MFKMGSLEQIPEEMIEMQPRGASSRLKGEVSALKKRIHKHLPHINITHTAETRLWMVCMLLLGTFDVLINWLNFYEMSSEHMSKGLGIGPPMFQHWLSLLVFSAIGSILYIPESLNTISSLWNKGRTRFPIVWELLIVLSLEQIPLSAINYFIVRCRRKYITSTQTCCGVVNIVYVFVRLVWFAHIEGNLKENKTPNRKFYFMLCGALFSSAFAFPVMSWRMRLDEIKWNDISIVLVKTNHLKDSHIGKYNLTEILQKQGVALNRPSLVPTLNSINATHLHSEIYPCVDGAEFVPQLCDRGEYLVFKFSYIEKEILPPYGQITYNMAVISNSTCIPSKEKLTDDWGLFYVKILILDEGAWTSVMASDPWPDQCTTSPYPSYDQSIRVCSSLRET